MDFLDFQVLIICLFLTFSYLCLRVYGFLWGRPKRLEKSLKQQGIRGTPYKALFGDIKEFMKHITEARSKPISLSHDVVQRVHPFTYSVVQKYGKISFCWIGRSPRLTVMDPTMIKEVLTNKHGHFGKPPYNPIILTLTRGLTTLEGEKWAAHRRVINPAFQLEKLRGMVPVFVSSSAALMEKWKLAMGNRGSLEIDICPEFEELTADVISRTAFGSSYQEGKEIFKFQKELMKLVFEAMQTLYLPGFRFIPTKKNRRIYKLDKNITWMLRNLVERKERTMEKGEDNLLSLLLQSNSGNNQQGNSSTRSHIMTVNEIIEECKLFYIAGHETTSSWLTWTVIVLAMHQDWQHMAREEVLKICKDKDLGADAISHLKIVNMILHEVLRLYPPATALYQRVYKESRIGNLDIPAGVDLMLPIMLLNHDTDLWGDDAREFKPQRFSEGISKACKAQAAFLPFGWGPRTCMGQSFAVMEAKIALASILKGFWFELSPSYIHAPRTVMMLEPQHGAQVVFHSL